VDVIHTADLRAEAPRPPQAVLAPLLALAAAAAVVLGLCAAAGLRGDTLLVAPISLALLGVVLTVRRWDERRRLCAAADAWIARGHDGASYDWRVAELTSRRERRLLANSVRDIVPELSEHRLPGASPLNRVALRPYRSELIELADRLDDLDRPVSASGVLAVRRLLTEPGSALYARDWMDKPAPDPGRELAAVLASLEAGR
jgi:hypothetical protein